MPDFSVILQTPQFRALTQENALQRLFYDGLYPSLLFRMEAEAEKWEANVGDDKVFTGKGLMPVDLRPLQPGKDPEPGDYTAEQWRAQCQKWANTIDTHMGSSVAMAVSKISEDLKELGKNAGLTMNRLVRNEIANSTASGWTVVDGAQNASTIRVKRLNGFTRARRPDLTTGSPVRYELVSASNPLPITIDGNARNVTGFTPDTAGDEVGPGTLTLSGGSVNVADRAYVYASTRTYIVRVGGGNATDALTAGTDILHLADIRAAVQRLRNTNVPTFGDGTYHAHFDPTSEGQIFADSEFQRLHESLPESSAYKDFGISRMLGMTFLRNNECPQIDNVYGGSTATFSQRDPYAGELYHNGNASTGSKVHRVLCLGAEALREYYVDQNALITEVGVGGKVTNGVHVSANGVDIDVNNVHIIMRQPQDRLAEMVAQTWKFQGDWVMRTDGATGDAAVYKRSLEIQHTE